MNVLALDAREAATALRISIRHLRALVARGELAKLLRPRIEDNRRFLREHEYRKGYDKLAG